MTKVIETRNNTFKFYDKIDDELLEGESPDCIIANLSLNQAYLEVKITVIEKEYIDTKRFYYIDYKYKLITSSDMCEAKKFRLFRNTFPFDNDKCNSNGEVVYKNDLTSKMVDYILMNDDELEKHTNINKAQTYRGELMKALVSLWD
jgi:hypothetical protein